MSAATNKEDLLLLLLGRSTVDGTLVDRVEGPKHSRLYQKTGDCCVDGWSTDSRPRASNCLLVTVCSETSRQESICHLERPLLCSVKDSVPQEQLLTIVEIYSRTSASGRSSCSHESLRLKCH